MVERRPCPGAASGHEPRPAHYYGSPDTPSPGHNNGPPLDDDPRPCGSTGIGTYFEWAVARKKAFDVPYNIAIMRARLAQALGCL